MPSKAEKRLALQALKQQKFEKKRAVAVEKILAASLEKKVPAPYKPGDSRLPHLMLYGKGREDRAESWSWGAYRDWHPDPGDDVIYAYLDGYLNKTWGEIEAETTRGKKGKTAKRHKSYPIAAICKEAQERLVLLQLDDQERIFRFRMAAKKRLFGFIFGVTFETVWYDAEHLICPMAD